MPATIWPRGLGHKRGVLLRTVTMMSCRHHSAQLHLLRTHPASFRIRPDGPPHPYASAHRAYTFRHWFCTRGLLCIGSTSLPHPYSYRHASCSLVSHRNKSGPCALCSAKPLALSVCFYLCSICFCLCSICLYSTVA